MQVRGTQSSWLPPAVIPPLPSPHPRILPCFGAPAGNQVSPVIHLTLAPPPSPGDFQPITENRVRPAQRNMTRLLDDWASTRPARDTPGDESGSGPTSSDISRARLCVAAFARNGFASYRGAKCRGIALSSFSRITGQPVNPYRASLLSRLVHLC